MLPEPRQIHVVALLPLCRLRRDLLPAYTVSLQMLACFSATTSVVQTSMNVGLPMEDVSSTAPTHQATSAALAARGSHLLLMASTAQVRQSVPLQPADHTLGHQAQCVHAQARPRLVISCSLGCISCGVLSRCHLMSSIQLGMTSRQLPLHTCTIANSERLRCRQLLGIQGKRHAKPQP